MRVTQDYALMVAMLLIAGAGSLVLLMGGMA